MGGDFKSPLCDLLREHGCTIVRQGSKHEVWHSPISDKSFTVPRGIYSRHTANGILKQAGIDHKI